MHNLIYQFQNFGVTGCKGENSFFGFPTWYKYLPANLPSGAPGQSGAPGCTFAFVFPDSLPLIALALIEIALRIAGLVAIFFIVYGGITYVVSQGEPDKISQAKGTIINALVGLLIATFAIAIVAFVGNRVG